MIKRFVQTGDNQVMEFRFKDGKERLHKTTHLWDYLGIR